LDGVELKKLFVVCAVPLEVFLLRAERGFVVRVVLLEVLPGVAFSDPRDLLVGLVEHRHSDSRKFFVIFLIRNGLCFGGSFAFRHNCCLSGC